MSPEELRGLLGDEEDGPPSDSEAGEERGELPVPTDPSASESVARDPVRRKDRCGVLVVSRRRDEMERVVRFLRERGAAVEVARDAFRALDRLREGGFLAVISDLSLWPAEGRLLIQRVAIPVIFLAEAPAASSIAGAWGVLMRPIDTVQLERMLGALLREIAEVAPPMSSSLLRGKGAVPSPLDEPPGWNPVVERVQRAEDRAAARFDAAAQHVDDQLAGELPWLRLCHRAGRAVRSGMLDDRSFALLVLETLGGSSAAVCLRRRERSSILVESRTPDTSWRLVDFHDASLLRVAAELKDGKAEILIEGLPAAVRAESERYSEDLRWFLREVTDMPRAGE